MLEVGGNGVTGWAVRKGGKQWRYGLVLCAVLYCLILSVSIYILHQTRSTLNTIAAELTDSCESSAFLGSLQLAYDLAYQSTRAASQSIFNSDISLFPSLTGLKREIYLLQSLEKSSNCGGMCFVRPQIFTSGEMPSHSCKRPLLALLEAGQSVTLGLLISVLVLKTLALGLFYAVVFRKRGKQAYLPRFPMLIGPPLEQPQGQPSDPETHPAEVSFSKPVSPASRPQIQDEGLSLSSSSEEKADSDD